MKHFELPYVTRIPATAKFPFPASSKLAIARMQGVVKRRFSLSCFLSQKKEVPSSSKAGVFVLKWLLVLWYCVVYLPRMTIHHLLGYEGGYWFAADNHYS